MKKLVFTAGDAQDANAGVTAMATILTFFFVCLPLLYFLGMTLGGLFGYGWWAWFLILVSLSPAIYVFFRGVNKGAKIMQKTLEVADSELKRD